MLRDQASGGERIGDLCFLNFDHFRTNPRLLSNLRKSGRDVFMSLAPIDGQVEEKIQMNGFGDNGDIF